SRGRGKFHRWPLRVVSPKRGTSYDETRHAPCPKGREIYVKLWEETVEMKTSPTIRPITPLQRLLAEYRDTCERILDEKEIEVGLWAYKRRSQGPRRWFARRGFASF